MVNADNKVGTLVNGRYLIKKTLGNGASSSVYLADDMQFGREVALKILAPDANGLHLNTLAFETEANVITALSHDHNDHIVEIYDVSLGSGDKYIVMEYVPGVTLRAYMDQGLPMKTDEVYNCAEQILLALRMAHKKGVVHRDIKPQNVIVTQSGQLKVTDFGIAKMEGADRFRIKDRAVGTVHYISPEQASGQDTDARSDIYSLGVMLYEMVTGKLPFDGATAEVIVQKQITENPIPPRELRPNIPAGLEQVILCAMEKDPSERFRNADAMLAAINKVRKNPTHIFSANPAQTDTVPTQPAKINAVTGITNILRVPLQAIGNLAASRTRRQRNVLLAALAAAVVLLGGVITVLVLTLTQPSNAPVAVPDYLKVGEGEILDEEDIADLQQRMANDGFYLMDVIYEYNDTVPKGAIISSTVDGMETASYGTSVRLTVSYGPSPVSPDYISLTMSGYFEDARNRLEEEVVNAYGACFLKYNITYSVGVLLPDGFIVSWETAEGDRNVTATSTLNVTVVTEEYSSLLGQSLESVKNVFEELDAVCTLKQVTEAPAGTVLAAVTKISYTCDAEGSIAAVELEYYIPG